MARRRAHPYTHWEFNNEHWRDYLDADIRKRMDRISAALFDASTDGEIWDDRLAIRLYYEGWIKDANQDTGAIRKAFFDYMDEHYPRLHMRDNFDWQAWLEWYRHFK